MLISKVQDCLRVTSALCQQQNYIYKLSRHINKIFVICCESLNRERQFNWPQHCK